MHTEQIAVEKPEKPPKAPKPKPTKPPKAPKPTKPTKAKPKAPKPTKAKPKAPKPTKATKAPRLPSQLTIEEAYGEGREARAAAQRAARAVRRPENGARRATEPRTHSVTWLDDGGGRSHLHLPESLYRLLRAAAPDLSAYMRGVDRQLAAAGSPGDADSRLLYLALDLDWRHAAAVAALLSGGGELGSVVLARSGARRKA